MKLFSSFVAAMLAIAIGCVAEGAPATKKTAGGKKPAKVATKNVWMDVPSGFAKAKQENKWIVADVYTDWCGWCKKLDRDTFHNPSIERYLASYYVCVKVNAEDGGAGQQLARRNGVSSFPTIMVFAPNGTLKGVIEGYVSPAEFGPKLQEIVSAR